MNREDIVRELKRLQDSKYAVLQAKLIPTVSPERIIGVRTPELRSFAAKIASDPDTAAFLSCLPHEYFEEDQLHAFIISREKDFEKCAGLVEGFLPFIDNWATCDQLSPAAFKKHRPGLLPYIEKWLRSDREYTVRFAIGMLMEHFLDADFSPEYADAVAAVRSDRYYVKMMAAWYFATALAKQYASVIPYLEERRLEQWTHNKAIQKAVESRRITPEQKDYLRTLRIR